MSKFVPLRKFIFDRLYHPKGGYFCRKDFQVGELSHPINFKSLIGFDDYQQQLYRRYPKNAWLTPSQIFKPYYGMSIGNYIRQATQRYHTNKSPNKKIKIVEAGAGTGSAAQSILFYFQNFSQQYFENIEYNIVEISPTLCTHMKKKLQKSYPRLMENKQIRIINQDIMDFKANNNELCFMLFFEVLDNLPHDKVIKAEQQLQYHKYSVVDVDTRIEQYKNIDTDDLIKECLQMHQFSHKFNQKIEKSSRGFLDRIAETIFQRYYQPKVDDNQLFLPTYFLQLLKRLSKNVPKAHLIVSDFDRLISSVPGKYAPIVSFKGESSAEKKDFNTYLVDRGQADIFFPTNFNLIRHMHKQTLGRDANVLKSYEFFEEFSHEKWSTSKSGFNPIREDFGNTSFLVSKI